MIGTQIRTGHKYRKCHGESTIEHTWPVFDNIHSLPGEMEISLTSPFIDRGSIWVANIRAIERKKAAALGQREIFRQCEFIGQRVCLFVYTHDIFEPPI